MSNREYPFMAWVLGGTFIPKQIEFRRGTTSCGEIWHRSENGKFYSDSEAFRTKSEAIAYGLERLSDQEARIMKMKTIIAKKRANLEKNS